MRWGGREEVVADVYVVYAVVYAVVYVVYAGGGGRGGGLFDVSLYVHWFPC